MLLNKVIREHSCGGYYGYTVWRDTKVEDLPLKGLSDANKTADFD